MAGQLIDWRAHNEGEIQTNETLPSLSIVRVVGLRTVANVPTLCTLQGAFRIFIHELVSAAAAKHFERPNEFKGPDKGSSAPRVEYRQP
jgi:hypothetical protein